MTEDFSYFWHKNVRQSYIYIKIAIYLGLAIYTNVMNFISMMLDPKIPLFISRTYRTYQFRAYIV